MFRMNSFSLLVVWSVVAGSAGEAVSAPFVLARNGVARAPIVLATDATDRQRELAAELADYLEQISGATFAVTTGDGRAGIVLGTPRQFAAPYWTKALEIRGRDGFEAYGIRTTTNRLLVLGATDLGLDRGLTRLLHELGCRWFFPGKTWRIVPKRKRVAVDLDVTDRPALLSRVIWWDWGPWDGQARRDHQEWMRRNWMGESLKVRCSHAWQRIIAENRSTITAHPEYLAWRPSKENDTGGGERGGSKLCTTNPEVIELCRQYALDYFARHPDEDMVSLEPSDGGGYCECAQCRATGSVPERVHALTNEVAKAVAAEYPGKYVGTYAYSLHSEPPSFGMAPNVYVQITAGFTRGRYTFLQLIDQWAKHVRQLGIYEYFAVWAWGRDLPGRPRGSNLAYLAERIPYYAAHRATTMSCESAADYGICGLGYLVASRLMWNPHVNVTAVCQDFYDKAFGPAAAVMKLYYDRFDAGNKPLLSDHLLAQQYRTVAQASRLAADRPDVLARLDDVKLYLHYVRLMRALETSRGKEARLKALFPVLNLAYRTRHRYIVHSTGIRGRYATYYLRGLQQPADWDYRKTKGKPAWCTGGDYTHDEVERLFQEGLHRFKLQHFARRMFSTDLVPGDFAPFPHGGAALLRFQGGESFLMLSRRGEPLTFRLLTGVIAWYRDRRPTEWTVTDGKGNAVSSGTLPLDGKWHPVHVVVPRAGLYHFSLNDFGAGWQLDYDPGKPYVWALERGRRAYSMGNHGWLYFYVPSGAKTIAYHVEGSAHSVLDGDGKQVARIDHQPGNVVVVPVPPGQAGRVWCLKGLSRTHLWFFNCPNYLAAHAQDLLVPEETLKRE